ncbi:MAG: class I SAM-dependent methyltransferase [Pseudomonadota bacterium]
MALLQKFKKFRQPAANDPSTAPAKHDWPQEPGLPAPLHHENDLISIDQSYAGMYALHKTCHQGLIAELKAQISGSAKPRLLEVACGSGWNTQGLHDAGFDYWGLDLSENAIAVAMRRYPSLRFINCDVRDTTVLADGAFNYVFCASMLEHIGDFQTALKNLIRISGKHLYVLFYEGLPKDHPDKFEHRAFDNPEWNRWFGKKLAAYQHEHKGYYMRRFARNTIEAIVKETQHVGYEIFDKDNRPYITNEAILHVWK